MNLGIVRFIKGQKRFIGKLIGKTFYREAPYSKAVLWQTKELSFDKLAFDYISTKVTKIVFSDTTKSKSYEIGIKKFTNNMRVDEYGEGKQVYIKKDLLKELPEFKKTPYVKFEQYI